MTKAVTEKKKGRMVSSVFILFLLSLCLFLQESTGCTEYDSCITCTSTRIYNESNSSLPSSNFRSRDGENSNSFNRCHWCAIFNVEKNFYEGGTCYDRFKDPLYCLNKGENREEFANIRNNGEAKKSSVVQFEENIAFDDKCPVNSNISTESINFLSNWIGNLVDSGILNHTSLLDLTLPGTHDSLSYDLDLVISDSGADDYLLFDEITHDLSKVEPKSILDFIRQQAQTQALDIVAQLNNGIRFIDFRIMFEYSSVSNNKKDWYSVHFLQTIKKASSYFEEIKKWLDEHPQEVVVLWISRHGSTSATGDSQYPNVPISVKQQFWQNIESIFKPLLVDFRHTKINETSVAEMINKNERCVIYATDYEEFTNHSYFALDGALVDNQLGPSLKDGEMKSLQWETTFFQEVDEIRKKDKLQQSLLLLSMASDVPSTQVETLLDIKYGRYLHPLQPYDQWLDSRLSKCANAFLIPNMTQYCPSSLLEIAQLENYYKQIALEEVIRTVQDGNFTLNFPNAIYINAVDIDGTFRTGSQVMWADFDMITVNKATEEKYHRTTKYGYADTLILYNVIFTGEKNKAFLEDKKYQQLVSYLKQRKSKYPLTLWDDFYYGRHETMWNDADMKRDAPKGTI